MTIQVPAILNMCFYTTWGKQSTRSKRWNKQKTWKHPWHYGDISSDFNSFWHEYSWHNWPSNRSLSSNLTEHVSTLPGEKRNKRNTMRWNAWTYSLKWRQTVRMLRVSWVLSDPVEECQWTQEATAWLHTWPYFKLHWQKHLIRFLDIKWTINHGIHSL